jgi:hypothetical protein
MPRGGPPSPANSRVIGWIAEIERDDDRIDLPTTAAELIAEDRAYSGS